MIVLKLYADEEKILMKALQTYRNKLNAERKYDGVTVTRRGTMEEEISAADDLMGKIGDL